MSDQDLKAELDKLRAENEQLKSQRGRSVGLKVSEKGGLSVYGLGRFPVTLYKEQWTKLLAMADEIRSFIKEHDGELKTIAIEGDRLSIPESRTSTGRPAHSQSAATRTRDPSGPSP